MLIMPLLFFLAFVLLTSLVYVLCLDNIESLQHLQHKNLTNSVISYWKTKHGNCKGFEVKVGLHQGLLLSPLLFVAVMEVLMHEVRKGLPWELLYVDDLVLMDESMGELKVKVLWWKDCKVWWWMCRSLRDRVPSAE